MKFAISRTSNRIDEQDRPPCEGAVWQPTIHVDVRSVDDPSKLRYATDWYGHGTNHRVIGGHIMRDLPTEGWFIELNTLEELTAFVLKHDEMILSVYSRSPDAFGIEIYDDYRE